MSYRLDPALPLVEEVRRIAREQLGKAAECLNVQDGDRDEAIHDARKHFKKVRGLYRLVRTGDEDFQKRENARVREIAATLSGVRDATALIETVDDLAAHLPLGTVPEELTVARNGLVARRDRLLDERQNGAGRMAEAADGCREALAALDDLAISRSRKEAAAIVARGWRRTCGKAAKALAECRAEGREEAFHTLRKRVKDHAVHARLLRDLWPTSMRLRQQAADRLAKIIGAEHNLTILGDLMRNEPDAVGGAAARQLLERLVDDRRAELRDEATDRASLLFGERAKREAKHVELMWRQAAS